MLVLDDIFFLSGASAILNEQQEKGRHDCITWYLSLQDIEVSFSNARRQLAIDCFIFMGSFQTVNNVLEAILFRGENVVAEECFDEVLELGIFQACLDRIKYFAFWKRRELVEGLLNNCCNMKKKIR